MSKPIPASVQANRDKFRAEGQARKDARQVAHLKLIDDQKALGQTNRDARAAATSS